MDDDNEMPPLRAVIPLHLTAPLTRADDPGEGDMIVFPTADRVFVVGHVLEDGSYGGDVCRADNFNCLLSWEWYTVDEMVENGMRIFINSHTEH